jgi:LmbE family N-acetylglucosaminyl deacetylase
MHTLSLDADRRIDTILVVGAHADDAEIGCGGTILRLAASHPHAEVVWVVLCAGGDRAEEARRSAEDFLQGFANTRIVVKDFRDAFLPYVGGTVKELFEELKATVTPQLVFTHQGSDLHQDHRLLNELTWNTFRDHLILEYEIPKYDGDLGSPNVFVQLDEETVRRKTSAVLAHFATQRDKRWFTEDTFRSLMRLRGMECNSETGHAEAFYCRKLVVEMSA